MLFLMEDKSMALYAADNKICDVQLSPEFIEKQANLMKQRQREKNPTVSSILRP